MKKIDYQIKKPQSNYSVDYEGELVEEFNGFTIDNVYCPDEPDSIFGLGNKKKQAERKLKRAEKKLAKGKTKRAGKLIYKASNILGKIQQGNVGLLQQKQALQNIATQQGQLKTEDQKLAEINQANDTNALMNNLQMPSYSQSDATPMAMGGGGMVTENVDATPEPMTMNDEPTGNLAQEKTLSNVNITSKKTNWVLIGVVILAAIIAIVFLPKLLKKK